MNLYLFSLCYSDNNSDNNGHGLKALHVNRPSSMLVNVEDS